MDRFEEIQNHRQEVQSQILKGFGLDIEKGGVYVDNSENRRLMRVGQSYGKEGSPRRGDTVEVVGPTGMKFTGKVTDVANGGTVTIHTGGNSYFSGKVTRNFTGEKRKEESDKKKVQREKDRKEEKRWSLQRQLRQVERDLRRVDLDQEQDPDVLADPDNGDNPAVKRYGREMEQLDRKRSSILQQLKSLE